MTLLLVYIIIYTTYTIDLEISLYVMCLDKLSIPSIIFFMMAQTNQGSECQQRYVFVTYHLFASPRQKKTSVFHIYYID